MSDFTLILALSYIKIVHYPFIADYCIATFNLEKY